MHTEILNSDQNNLLPLISSFKKEFYLVGGTAISLYIGHRRSIDFDLFKNSKINHKRNLDKIIKHGYSYIVTRRVEEQMNLIVNNVKITFFEYPFDIKAVTEIEKTIKIPSLLDLAAMKSYALGRRSKWKDYIDLYFILKYYLPIETIINKAKEIFGELFSDKLFRAQLSYFDDIDYSESVDYLVEAPSNEEVKNFLINISTIIL